MQVGHLSFACFFMPGRLNDEANISVAPLALTSIIMKGRRIRLEKGMGLHGLDWIGLRKVCGAEERGWELATASLG
jgi:hypothetical protein